MKGVSAVCYKKKNSNNGNSDNGEQGHEELNKLDAFSKSLYN